MTREEAKEFLMSISWKLGNMGIEYLSEKDGDKMREAIEVLEQQPCEDCISRTAVLDGLANIAKGKAKSDAQKAMMGRSMFFIERLPSVQPEQKTGKWEYLCYQNMKCSRCDYVIAEEDNVEFRFCPNCGCWMKEGE